MSWFELCRLGLPQQRYLLEIGCDFIAVTIASRLLRDEKWPNLLSCSLQKFLAIGPVRMAYLQNKIALKCCETRSYEKRPRNIPENN